MAALYVDGFLSRIKARTALLEGQCIYYQIQAKPLTVNVGSLGYRVNLIV